MWRCHRAVQATAQRWLRRDTSPSSVLSARAHQHVPTTLCLYNSSACIGTAAGRLTANRPLLGSGSHLSLTRYGDVGTNNYLSSPLLISTHDFSTRRPRVPMMKDLHSIEDVIVTAYEYLDIMSRRDVGAVWARIQQLMTKRQPRQQRESSAAGELSFDDTEHMLYTIFDNTTDGVEYCGARELTETTLGMAKIGDILREQGVKRREDSYRAILRRLLLSQDMAPNRELFKYLATASMNKIDQFDARSLSNLALAYAKIDYVPEFDDGSDLFDHIAIQAVHVKADFSEQGISNLMWSYATVNKPHPVLFETVGDQVVAKKHLGEFVPQALSNTVWAYATAGINHPKLFSKVANHIVESDIFEQFEPQHLSNTVWAYAKAGVDHPRLFEKVANHIVQSDTLDLFEPQELKDILWAYATAGIKHPQLFEKVANHIVESNNLKRFSSQDFSNTVWAYTTAGINHPKLFEKVANQIVHSNTLDQFIPQAFSNTVWAYATAQVSHPKLFQKVASAALRRKEEFISQHVANLLWAYATMGIIDKQLFSSFESTAKTLIDTFNNQDLSHIAWAYAVANFDAQSLFNKAFIKKCVGKKDGFEVEALFQLYQWHLWQTKEKSNPGLPQELLDKCHEAFISEDPTISKFQDDVVAQLVSIGLEPKEEVLMNSGYRIDAVVEVNGKTIGVEVDGPSHFIGRSNSPLGSTIIKRRQVPSIDSIEHVSVPYWEWDKLGKNKTKKQDYLRRLLRLESDNE